MGGTKSCNEMTRKRELAHLATRVGGNHVVSSISLPFPSFLIKEESGRVQKLLQFISGRLLHSAYFQILIINHRTPICGTPNHVSESSEELVLKD